jgi:hypothetical protein
MKEAALKDELVQCEGRRPEKRTVVNKLHVHP